MATSIESAWSTAVESWGRWPQAVHHLRRMDWAHETPDFATLGSDSVLAHGLGRSYGDSCLNDHGTLLLTAGMKRLIAFDRASGVIRAEAGTSLADLLAVIVPAGWFLPVTPGTKYVTLGGAVANDVHGKNHHAAGTFGRHVTAFELLRSDGSRRVCSPTENADLFAATIGGLGLTGIMTWVELRLRPVESPFIDVTSIKFDSLDEFFALSAANDPRFEHTVSWLDCLSPRGRGLYMGGNHAPAGAAPAEPAARRSLSVPLDFPSWCLNPLSIRAFNQLYFMQQRRRVRRSVQHYEPFFYPLDAVDRWNRIYGARGFFQYQFVMPADEGMTGMKRVYHEIQQSRLGSFLAVVKYCGALASPGLLSFPRPGVTLALDFPNVGAGVLALMDRLDAIVIAAGGALYPAKDARMSPAAFAACFPRRRELMDFVDPRFSSSFWRRVTKEPS